MDDDHFPNPTETQIKAALAERLRKRNEAGVQAGADQRRVAEKKQHKGLVNGRLLRTQTGPQRETWTIRARPDLKAQVEDLADELSKPGDRITVAALMEEAMRLLLAKYRGKQNGGANA
jgi:hypothetical protein